MQRSTVQGNQMRAVKRSTPVFWYGYAFCQSPVLSLANCRSNGRWRLSFTSTPCMNGFLHPRAMPSRIHGRNADADAPTTAKNALGTSHPRMPSPKAVTKLWSFPEPLPNHNRSNLRLKFLVRRINFLYLCFFIFSFRCRFTLITLHVSRIFSILPSSHLSCRPRILSRNGWRPEFRGSTY